METLNMSTTIGLKLDDETRERLKALGEIKDRSSHWIMKQAIADYLKREETSEREKQEDMKRWQAYQETGEFITNEDAIIRIEALRQKARDAQR
jgi:predicted transcriptional regulator